tara:strand:- start:418 stop:933 length:516 start_codon:yes stop_codon:yes gene_type:complete
MIKISIEQKKIIKKIINTLENRGLTLSLAESCTGGLLSSHFISISGVSRIFELALVPYSNKIKSKILKISKQKIAKYGAVSREISLEMASAVSKLSSSDINIAITGIAGPNGGTKNKPVGLVFISAVFVNKNKELLKRSYKFKFGKIGRNAIQNRSVNASLMIIEKIIKLM